MNVAKLLCLIFLFQASLLAGSYIWPTIANSTTFFDMCSFWMFIVFLKITGLANKG